MLRDLDEIIVPGLTHWNHPRFFAWFANTGSEPGVLAELLIAALNVNAFTWLSSPAATELEVTVMDWLAQLLGLPRGWHGHIEDTASTATIAALAAARTRKPGGVVYASEQANFSVEKAARLVGLEYRTVRDRRRVPDAHGLPARRRHRRRRDRRARPARRRSTRCPSWRAAATRPACGCTSTRRTPARPRCAPSCAGAWTASTAPTRSSINPHKWLFTPMDCSALWTRRPEAFHEAFALVPEYLAATPEAVDIKDYGPALGRRFRALKLWFVLRWYGAEGLRALIREHVRLAQLFAVVGRGRAGLGDRRAASVLDGVLPARGQRQLRPRRARERNRRGVPRRDASARRRHDPHRDRQREHDRGRHSPNLGGAAVVRVKAVVFDLWETLIDWDREANAKLNADLEALVGGRLPRALAASRPRKYNGPIRAALAEAGVSDEHMDDVCELRREYLRRCLVAARRARSTRCASCATTASSSA